MTNPVPDVALGWVHPGKVSDGFLDSLLRTVVADGGRRLLAWQGIKCSANISAGRNALVEWFLSLPAANWLMMIDTDMVWLPDAVHRLLASADADRAPIVGGLCFGIDNGEVFPTLYDLGGTEEKPEFVRYNAWPDGMFQVVGTGAAFLLVHRRVFEAIRDRGFNVAYPWFQEVELAGMRCGEDVTFCLRAGQLEFPVFVDTTVQTGHIKTQIVTADAYRAQREARAAAEEPHE